MFANYVALVGCALLSFFVLLWALGFFEQKRMASRRQPSVGRQVSTGVIFLIVATIDVVVIDLAMPHPDREFLYSVCQLVVVALAGYFGFVISGRRSEINRLLD